MAPKTIRKAIADALEDLSKDNFDKFCRQLLDRREEPRVRRNKVEGKSFLDIADILVSTFTERRAVTVTTELLKQIDCHCEADSLEDDVCEETPPPSQPGPSDTSLQFVEKHKVELFQRVSNIAPILDELFDKNVLQPEIYETIRALPTSQAKMREIYLCCLKGGEACKNILYEILERNEPYLIADLKEKK
ncbi:apoptosis-associated speck-like protein containing a CARD [Micropterus salmoides]|uniref:apoptosis-associated speck-like protein containing a CARD n=1 Tax=Micropterus salmoides TaxID=27706 RepID=UPI0018EC91E5|nr:apoptosis-associated speck-like protein containing a CARD [Micropterus salmoides]